MKPGAPGPDVRRPTKRLGATLRAIDARLRAADAYVWAWIDRAALRLRGSSRAAGSSRARATGGASIAMSSSWSGPSDPNTTPARASGVTGPTPAPAPPARPRPRRPGRSARSIAWALARRLRVPPLALLVAVGVVLIADIVLWERCGLNGCPDVMRLRAYQPNGAPMLYDRRGRLWGALRPVDRVIVPLDSVPWFVPAAFVAVEDKRFYKHHGVDFPRVMGAALRDIRSRGYAQGFSTIPMQLARNVWRDRIPAQEKTLRRKLMEVRVAYQIERKFSKKEILELYLNNIYFGDGAYGIEAAARDYFHRPAKALSLPQAALLAALPRAPSTYDPRDHAQRALQRRNLVLSLMGSGGFASPQLVALAKERPLGVSDEPARVPGQGIGHYFADLVRRQLEAMYGEDLYRSQMKIVTTLDVDAQRAAEEELDRQLRAIEDGAVGRLNGPLYRPHKVPGEAGTDYLQGAVVVMNAHTGDVLALVGGRDYQDSRYDRAIQARRQTGSSFKPFVYGRAIQAGIPISQHVLDEPTTFWVARRPWTPHDYNDEYHGDVTMRQAITQSMNVPTVRLASYVGVPSVISFAHRVGINAPIPNSPAAALGLAEVSPLELATAYTAFASEGTRAQPRLVRKVVSADGQLLWEAPPPVRTQVVEPGVAYILTDMLKDVVDRGTGYPVREAGFTGPVAGKTGTTSDYADAWFVGYTPDVVGTVWIGFDRRREIAAKATGGQAAGPVWGRMMRRMYQRWPAQQDWERPDNVVSLAVDAETGQTIQDGCNGSDHEGELFLTSAEPAAICPVVHVLGTPIQSIGGVITSIWHSIFGGGRQAPPPPQLPTILSTRGMAGPYDPTLGAPRVRMREFSGGNGGP